jgi:hypothetical protein
MATYATFQTYMPLTSFTYNIIPESLLTLSTDVDFQLSCNLVLAFRNIINLFQQQLLMKLSGTWNILSSYPTLSERSFLTYLTFPEDSHIYLPCSPATFWHD